MNTPASRNFSLPDRILSQCNDALYTLTVTPKAQRENPANQVKTNPDPHSPQTTPCLTPAEKKHSAGLMRVNHTGEVCAQALYHAQALTARDRSLCQQMQLAAEEENDHLAWCAQRLADLDSRPSLSNPLWYATSFGLGCLAGWAGDAWSLGFVVETEHQVVAHLDSHLNKLPEHDNQSRAIVKQMRNDEAAHAATAQAAGANPLPRPVKALMSTLAKLMTWTTYRI